MALVIYSLSVVAFAGDFAFGRPHRAAAKAAAPAVAQLATVGAGQAARSNRTKPVPASQAIGQEFLMTATSCPSITELDRLYLGGMPPEARDA